MNNTDFTNLFMNKELILLLKRANSKEQIQYAEEYDELLNSGFMKYNNYSSDGIGNQLPIKDSISITEKGKGFLAYIGKDKFRFYLPIIISILSLIISIIALVKP